MRLPFWLLIGTDFCDVKLACNKRLWMAQSACNRLFNVGCKSLIGLAMEESCLLMKLSTKAIFRDSLVFDANYHALHRFFF